MANHSKEPERTSDQIEEEIAQTRSELDSTLDELGKRLSPSAVKEKTVEYAKEAATTAGRKTVDYAVDAAVSVGHGVERNQAKIVCAILLAGGALITRSYFLERRGRERQARHLYRILAWRDAIAAWLESQKEQLADSPAIIEAGRAARDLGGRLSDGAGDAVSQTQELVSTGLRHAIMPAKRAIASVESGTREHPLVALGLSVLAGILVDRLRR